MGFGQATQFSWQGKGQHKIVHRQQLSGLALKPLRGVVVLALVAGAVSAGLRVTGLERAILTGQKHLAVLLSSAAHDGIESGPLIGGCRCTVVSLKASEVVLGYSGEFHFTPAHQGADAIDLQDG